MPAARSTVRVVRTLPMLTQATIDAVRQWEFDPATVGSEPVVVTVTALHAAFTLTHPVSQPRDPIPTPVDLTPYWHGRLRLSRDRSLIRQRDQRIDPRARRAGNAAGDQRDERPACR